LLRLVSLQFGLQSVDVDFEHRMRVLDMDIQHCLRGMDVDQENGVSGLKLCDCGGMPSIGSEFHEMGG